MIREMSRDECLQILAGSRLARLGCAHDNQPYVVPVYRAYHQPADGEPCLYGFTTPGQKIAWMRANPLVCVEVDEVLAYDQWASVIAIGRYEELPEPSAADIPRLRAPERSRHVAQSMLARSADGSHRESSIAVSDDERLPAWQVLNALPVWWQPASAVWAARDRHDAEEPFIPVYYRIRIDRISGHEATPDATPDLRAGAWPWLRRALARFFGGSSEVTR